MQTFIRLTMDGVETVEADERPDDDGRGVWIMQTFASAAHLAECVRRENLRRERTKLPIHLFDGPGNRRQTIAEFEAIR